MTKPNTLYDREPAARISFVDPKSRLFCKELPPEIVALISFSFDKVKSRSGPFPDDWLMDATQLALTSRDNDELFEHPDCHEKKVLPQDALRLVIEAAKVEFTAHIGKMTPFYASLILDDLKRAVLRSLLASEPR